MRRFQHTAARRRLASAPAKEQDNDSNVSTHSRPKAAGPLWRVAHLLDFVSTHSRPKAAGLCNISGKQRAKKFQHTAARRRLGDLVGAHYHIQKFQHTAARRRLVLDAVGHGFACVVSTHSRPKAAGTTKQSETTPTCRFNTQPPEGGWRAAVMMRLGDAVSTHSRPKAAGRP